MRTFDRLFAEGAPLIRHRLHQRHRPPVDGGRWPVSVVLRPDRAAAERLEQTMTEVEAYAGPGHFRTGTIDTAELVRFRFEDGPSGRLMRPEVLARVPTGSPRYRRLTSCGDPAVMNPSVPDAAVRNA